MQTLEIREYQGRVRRSLIVVFVVISIGTLVASFFLPGRPLLSAGLGILAVGVMLVTSAYTMNRMANTEGLAAGWVAVDFVVKAAVILGSLLLARYVSVFDTIPVAIALVLAIFSTSLVHVTAVKAKQRSDSELG